MRALILGLVLAAPLPVAAHASEFGKKICDERRENKPAWQKEHYAFAITADGEHCGWAHGWEAVKYAIPTAIRYCKQNAKREQKPTCKIVYAK
jgi:hypothetical protein